ncbi:MAG: TetR/AcrR family transcriptional regulator [bacterium]|nr:TetR/AcrR family transcriptional regulator [bacterium]
MPKEARKERERRLRREHVMESAEELFVNQGFETTTMDQIARCAELSKSTLYTVFRSKDELIFAMHLRDAKLGFKALRSGTALGTTGSEKMVEYGLALYRFYEKNPNKLLLRAFLDFKGLDLGSLNDELVAEHDRHNTVEANFLREIVTEGQADGTIDPGIEIDRIMSHFIYTLHPIAKQALFSTHSFAYSEGIEYYESYLRFFVNGLRPQRERASS